MNAPNQWIKTGTPFMSRAAASTLSVLVAGVMSLTMTACSKSLHQTSGIREVTAAKPVPPAPRPRSIEAEPADLPSVEEPEIEPDNTPSLSNLPPVESLTMAKDAGEQRIPPPEIVVAKSNAADAARRLAEAQREEVVTAKVRLSDIFFQFDSWQLNNEGKQALLADAEWVKAHPTGMLMIEGHCDERGTAAYNLVLGEKRAKAIQHYLAELGVKKQRLAVVSYGKERPFCQERDERCYRQNRRGHLVVRAQ